MEIRISTILIEKTGNLFFFHSVFKEGIALLCGDQETVCQNFQLDKEEKKFSKKRAVTMIIQLIEKRYQ